MSFVSTEFLILLAVVFLLYHSLASVRAQNLLILLASYVFYGWWDWRFLSLLFGISIVNYGSALFITRARSRRAARLALVAALTVSLGALAVFKYFGFFAQSLLWAARLLGVTLDDPTLQILLPLGISFMTFQGMAYVIDVWRGETVAERDLVSFLAFKAFFPQLVAGPIERANHLLAQFREPRSLDPEKVARAFWLLLYGYLLKVVVADTLAPLVAAQFQAEQSSGWSVVLATLAFGLQIYGDFNGYSLIAKGAALLFGFELIFNFRFPYWAVSPSEFWRRWHISLSRWLRDYLYIPLGGSRGGTAATLRNLMLTMGLGGLWHGASWNFVLWGLLHGAALALWRLLSLPVEPRTPAGRALGWTATMAIVFSGWLLFRASSEEVLPAMLGALGNWAWLPVHAGILTTLLSVGLLVAVLEWAERRWAIDGLFPRFGPWVRYPVLSLFAVLVMVLWRANDVSFIYFEF